MKAFKDYHCKNIKNCKHYQYYGFCNMIWTNYCKCYEVEDKYKKDSQVNSKWEKEERERKFRI